MNIFEDESVERLFTTIANLKTAKECADFFGDLCTIKEIQDMAQRLETAILLFNKENYQAISAKVGVSSATISRVNRCLNYGTGGYKSVIDGMLGEKGDDENKR